METIFIIIYLLKKNCSENNLSKKCTTFFCFQLSKRCSVAFGSVKEFSSTQPACQRNTSQFGGKNDSQRQVSLLVALQSAFNPFICHLIDLISSIYNSSNLCVYVVSVCLCVCVSVTAVSRTTTGPI